MQHSTSDPISKMLGRRIPPEEVRSVINDAQYGFPYAYQLLGYPQPHPGANRIVAASGNDKIEAHYGLGVGTGGIVDGYEYETSTGCILDDPAPVMPLLFAYASAAAIAEEIRRSPLTLSSGSKISRFYWQTYSSDSYKSLTQLGNFILKEIIISRSDHPGDWSIQEVNDKSYPNTGVPSLRASEKLRMAIARDLQIQIS